MRQTFNFLNMCVTNKCVVVGQANKQVAALRSWAEKKLSISKSTMKAASKSSGDRSVGASIVGLVKAIYDNKPPDMSTKELIKMFLEVGSQSFTFSQLQLCDY